MTLSVLKTGIDEIDRQHSQLMVFLDDLMKHSEGDYGFSASLTALSQLMDYTKEHFAYEENLLTAYKYPLVDQQIAEHKQITDDVTALWKEIEAGEEIGEKLVNTFRNLIVCHINAEDIKFADFVANYSSK